MALIKAKVELKGMLAVSFNFLLFYAIFYNFFFFVIRISKLKILY